ncbi:MAG: anti-sigma factor [Rhizobiales bacterium]|nr:anti-sigma factor [Hyphomicrobiales bacterium]MBO6700329.1 anti-sigma factor [Hyphomicrobiales bacterium]MBO6737506.1 anti-sigma factor [Hyphomicrobiales bacterium]MBO6913437.1 anti-sigma factor [Hyphomicrobiales bacterium]MBO6955368.1 anti-sigma factor [Hyphomicrobiales bacterium]
MVTDPNLLGQPDDEALAAEYALGLLNAAERQAFEQRLRDEPALRATVASWDETFLPLADDFEPVAPPSGALAAIETRLFADASSQEANSGWLSSLWFWRSFSAVAAAAALFLALAVYLPSFGPRTEGQAFIAQLQNEGGSLSIAAYFEPGSATLVLTRASGEPAADRDFELWLIAPDRPPVSLGTLPSGERVEIAVDESLASQLNIGTDLAISDEPNGGSPTGQPTGDILAVSPLAALQT